MNGVHDMGGMDGFGKVEPEPNEPTFHAAWEGRVMAMVRAMGAQGAFNIDASRFAREALPPEVYLSSSYYKKWLLALERHLAALGMAGQDEVAAGHALRDGAPLKRGKFKVDDVERIMVRGSFGRDASGAGDVQGGRSRAREEHQSGDAYAAAALRARPRRRLSSASTAVTCSPTAPPMASAKIRNGSTRWCSRAANSGATTPTRP